MFTKNSVLKEVIFRKSNELGVPLDECEIIIKGLTDEKKIKEDL